MATASLIEQQAHQPGSGRNQFKQQSQTTQQRKLKDQGPDALDSSDDDDNNQYQPAQVYPSAGGATAVNGQSKANRLDQLLKTGSSGMKAGVKLPSVFQQNGEQVLGGPQASNIGNGLSAMQPGKSAGGRKNPFNQRRQTTHDDDLLQAASGQGQSPPDIHAQPTFGAERQGGMHGGERKNTSGTLNRNESQSQLTTSFEPMDQREVELRAQSGENSQMFMESQFTSANASNAGMGGQGGIMGRFNTMDGFGPGEFGEDVHGQGMPMQHQQQKITVNLEDAVLEEQKLFQILESLRNNLNASLYCDDWWDVTETGHFATIVAYQVVKDATLKQVMLKAQKYEAIAIGIVQFYHLLAYEQTTIDTQTSVNTYLKNLMFYIHQQFVIIIHITLSRIVIKQASSWEVQLKKTVDTKILKKLKNKDDATQMLRVYSGNCENIIKNICKANQNKRIFKIVDEWMAMLQKVPLDRIRDVLYNIEQFKADALKLPNINTSFNRKERTAAKSSNQSDGPVYGAAAKSAGQLNEKTSNGASKMLSGGNQGQTSLTGKNPFAILKASAIASTSSAVFPNNFTNLPKVSPPFLDPLLPEEEKSVYTLVLDLDETLIHNVEYQNDSFFLVRPGCVQFIETMARYYEIVIFTAALQEYADQVIDQIDVGNNIRYRLYRQHTSQNGPFLVKDLSLLGRDINKTIIIDNISDNFILQPDNGIFISTWYDDMRDRFLDEITPLLCEIVEKKVPDVRRALRTYRDQVLRQVSNGKAAPNIVFH